MSQSLSLRDYILLEARHTPLRPPALMALIGVAVVAINHVLLPALPQPVLAFMARGFQLSGMGGVLLLNDFMVQYFAPFFVGLIGLVRILVTAREEHQLELFLVKPMTATDFLVGRTLPILITTLGVGLLIAGAMASASVPYTRGAEPISTAGAFGAGCVLIALVLVQLSALGIAFVGMRDSFHALLVACIVWLAPLMPTATFLYRPDVFEPRPHLTAWIVLPTLIWNDKTTAWIGPLSLLCVLPLCALLVHAAGLRLARTDAA